MHRLRAGALLPQRDDDVGPCGYLRTQAFFVAVIHREVAGMSESTRPKRVVIVDADNPLEEIQGEFFWAEDHERIVAAERQNAYAHGYRAGIEAAARRQPTRIVVRPRVTRSPGRLLVRALLLLVILAFVIEVMLPTAWSIF